jgi:hypothetical protein
MKLNNYNQITWLSLFLVLFSFSGFAQLADTSSILDWRRGAFPKEEGAYRLFVFIEDKDERTAYANIPFYVMPREKDDPPAKKVRFKQQELEVESK